MKETFNLNAAGGKIQCCIWMPSSTPVGIIQIIHGIKEYTARYDALASYFVNKGYIVVGADHPGHGEAAQEDGTLGQLPGGWITAVKNIRHLQKHMKNMYPAIPYIVFGHSMGSFMLMTYLSVYGAHVDAAILSGTGWMNAAVLYAGSKICAAEERKLGKTNVSSLINKLMFGSYNNQIKNAETEYDWLTSDTEVVRAYLHDPLCSWQPTIELCGEMIRAMQRNQSPDNLSRIPKNLPIFFFAGQDDPVGNYGNGVLKAVSAFKLAGLTNCTVELYPHMRHECHNDPNKEHVFADIASWIEGAVSTGR